ncbi:hypothetical protein LMG31841_02879 [Paraburkholderia saeva]|uniref:Uncharacterized protein n=1 Tax=Paraburkholderia saeva TaxID=2777537 RepID=A0A9N8RXV4_9BURK|nr:hypothetical protein LMG31841_02879 [Paraburkholderia saeva]
MNYTRYSAEPKLSQENVLSRQWGVAPRRLASLYCKAEWNVLAGRCGHAAHTHEDGFNNRLRSS